MSSVRNPSEGSCVIVQRAAAFNSSGDGARIRRSLKCSSLGPRSASNHQKAVGGPALLQNCPKRLERLFQGFSLERHTRSLLDRIKHVNCS